MVRHPVGRRDRRGIAIRRRRAGRGRRAHARPGARRLYDRQDFNFAGPWGNSGFVEDYTAQVRGSPLGAVHLITFNADAEAQHIAANYRPLSSVMPFSRLLRESFTGAPYAELFLAGEA